MGLAKTINTGLFLNFKAVCPLNWKSGLILCMLYRAKMICLNDALFLKEVNQHRSLFSVNNYTSRFFDKVFKKFMTKDYFLLNHFSPDDKDTDFEMCFVKISYVGIHSKWFSNYLSEFIKRQFGNKPRLLFDTFKVNCYFQLKSKTPHALSSNVVYLFTCSCNTNVSYIGMYTRHLATRAGDHLNLDDSHISAIKRHLRSCRQCCNGLYNVTSFKILRKCNTDYDTKIHKALLIKN